MPNCVLITAIGRNELLERSEPPARKYCKKVGAKLEIIRKPKWSIDGPRGYNYLAFEKNQVADYLKSYDHVLRLDADTLITERCPNIFELQGFCGVFEDTRSRRSQRRKEIVRLQKVLGDVGWIKGYFNGGVVYCGKEHKEAFQIDPREIIRLAPKLGPFKEQSYLNWMVHNLGISPKPLNPKWNRMSMFEDVPKEDAFIIHYAGPRPKKQAKLMDADLDKIGW
jgi:lipopolysaccharide biosynthesis glycosyltransferase